MDERSEPKIVQERVKERAKLVGYKAANLDEMKRLCESEPKPSLFLYREPPKVAVPALLELTDIQIKAYLERRRPDCLKLWAKFQTAQSDGTSELTSEAKSILAELRKALQEAFNASTFLNKRSALYADMTPFLEKKYLLTVRSTGEEDSVDLANPGGNDTVPAVSASSIDGLFHAIGVVVSSYFSEKSMKQRLLSKNSQITQDAFMPVFLQTMVCEPLGGTDKPGDIISSGVMYVEDDIVLIQVAPGHGELVVDGLGAFDTFEITKEDMVYASIAHKPDRLVPSREKARQLTWKENPKSVQDSACLSLSVIQRLVDMGRKTKAHYGMSRDIEFCYSPSDHTIWFVQSRPIPSSDVKACPSSIPPAGMAVLKQAIREGQVQMCHVQVVAPARFAAKVITEPAQLLICRDIDAALNQYLKQEHSPVQAVIVHDMAATTSHAAAQFNSLSISVLQTKDTRMIEQWIEQPHAVLVVDTQRNQVLDYTKKILNATEAKQQLESEGLLADGLFTHPLVATTLQSRFYDHSYYSQHGKRSLGYQMGHSHFTFLSWMHKKIDTTLLLDNEHLYTQLLENIEQLEVSTSHSETNKALGMIRAIVYRVAKSEPRVLPIFQQMMWVCEEIERHLAQETEISGVRLQLISKLSSLIRFEGSDVIFSNSLLQIMQDKKVAREILESTSNLSRTPLDYLTQFLKLTPVGFTQKTRDDWAAFATMAVKDGESIQKLATIVQFYKAHDLEADLLNNVFETLLSQKKTMKVILQTLYDDCLMSKKESVRLNMAEKNRVLRTWASRVQQWSHREKFSVLWEAYHQQIASVIQSIDIPETANPTTQKMILSQVLALTEMMDSTIKAAKSSDEYADDPSLLVQRFSQLLGPYHELMRKVAGCLPENVFWGSGVEKKQMLSCIQSAFSMHSGKRNVRQLTSSGCISVAACTIGSAASFHRQFYEHLVSVTLEDLFSLMHQNTLYAISVLNQSISLPLDRLPEQLHPLLSAFQAERSFDLKCISYANGLITIEYNQPLWHHSAKYTIEYRMDTQEITFYGYLFGLNHAKRMDAVAETVAYEGKRFNYDVKLEPKYSEEARALTFAWVLSAEQLKQYALSIRDAVVTYGNMTDVTASAATVSSRKGSVDQRYMQSMPSDPNAKDARALIKRIQENKALCINDVFWYLRYSFSKHAYFALLIHPAFTEQVNDVVRRIICSDLFDTAVFCDAVNAIQPNLSILLGLVSLAVNDEYYKESERIIKVLERLFKTQKSDQWIEQCVDIIFSAKSRYRSDDWMVHHQEIIVKILMVYCKNDPTTIQSLLNRSDSSMSKNDRLIEQLIQQNTSTPALEVIVQYAATLPEADRYLQQIAAKTKSLPLLRAIIDHTNSTSVWMAILQHPKVNKDLLHHLLEKSQVTGDATIGDKIKQHRCFSSFGQLKGELAEFKKDGITPIQKSTFKNQN